MNEHNEFLMWNLTWPEIKENLKTNDIALISVSSTEQHGRHLPVCTDAAIGSEVCKRTLKKFYDLTNQKALLATEIKVGMSKHHMSFPGTLSLEPETLMNVIIDICKSLIHHGYKKIILVNSHGGNTVLDAALRKIKDIFNQDDLYLFVVYQWVFDNEKWKEIGDAGPAGSAHAGERETSLMMALGYDIRVEELPEKAQPPIFIIPEYTSFNEANYSGSVSWTWNTPEITKDGYIGDPTANPNAQKGETSFETRADAFAKFLIQVDKL